MLSITTEFDCALALQLAQDFAPLTARQFAPVLSALQCHQLEAGDTLWSMGQRPAVECFVLQGLLYSSAVDASGQEVVLGFHRAPSVLPPAITRSEGLACHGACTALAPSRVAVFAPEVLIEAMVAQPQVREWGNAVLRHALLAKSRREWALAVYSGAQRLAQLRQDMPGLEHEAPHRLIASYLGMTAVSLSRLRKARETQGLVG